MAVSLGKLLGAGCCGNHQAIVLEQGLQPAGGAFLVDQLDHAVCHGFLAGCNACLHHAGINIKRYRLPSIVTMPLAMVPYTWSK